MSFGNDYVVRPDGSITDNAKEVLLKYPSYNTTDAGLSYTFNIGNNQRLIITGMCLTCLIQHIFQMQDLLIS